MNAAKNSELVDFDTLASFEIRNAELQAYYGMSGAEAVEVRTDSYCPNIGCDADNFVCQEVNVCADNLGCAHNIRCA